MKFSLNLRAKNKKKIILFSLPTSNHYQKIDSLKINPKNYQIIKENQWGNKIVILRLNDILKTSLKIYFKFTPYQFMAKINPHLTIVDYQNKKNKIINNRFINGKDPQIKKLALQVVGKETNLQKIIQKLYSFTLDFLTYGKPTEGLYSSQQAMKKKITDCGGFSTFLASLLQSVNIPSRLVVGYLIKKNILTNLFSNFEFFALNFEFLKMHAWLELLLPDNSWFPLDPSIEWRRTHGLTKRKGGFGYIPADRLVISFGCDSKIKINDKIYKADLLQNPIYL